MASNATRDVTDPTRYGARLARRREARGLTQRDLALLADVNQATISRVEAGRQIPTAAVVAKLERALADATLPALRARYRA